MRASLTTPGSRAVFAMSSGLFPRPGVEGPLTEASVVGCETSQDTRDIPIHDCRAFTEDDRGHRTCGVATHAREGLQLACGSRNLTTEILEDPHGRRLEVFVPCGSTQAPAMRPSPPPRAHWQGLRWWETVQESAGRQEAPDRPGSAGASLRKRGRGSRCDAVARADHELRPKTSQRGDQKPP